MKVFSVDAFTNIPFTGNPAAVVPLGKILPDQLMQKIAAELNLSETAFVTSAQPVSTWKNCSKFKLRWFTPTTEVPLCGHATLASAHVIFFEYGNNSEKLEFETLSGILTARKNGHQIVLDLPSMPPKPITITEDLKKLIQATTGQFSVQEVQYNAQSKKLLIRLHDEITREQLESISINFSLLKEHDGSIVRGIIVTVKGKDNYDFLSRYFSPWNGLPEDPVTGSAHSVLAPYWSQQLQKMNLHCCQCSSRGGELSVNMKDDRIDLSGVATTVLEGALLLPDYN